jgi:hypothetical protein
MQVASSWMLERTSTVMLAECSRCMLAMQRNEGVDQGNASGGGWGRGGGPAFFSCCCGFNNSNSFSTTFHTAFGYSCFRAATGLHAWREGQGKGAAKRERDMRVLVLVGVAHRWCCSSVGLGIGWCCSSVVFLEPPKTLAPKNPTHLFTMHEI